MNCQYNLFFVKMFLFFSISVYSTEFTYEEKAIVKINASEYKNQQFQFNYPFFGTKIELTHTGEGFIVLPINKMLFTELKLNETNTIPLFIKPGDEISLNIRKGDFTFTGKGADPNNYLLKAFSFLEQLRDSISIAINDSPEKFIAVCKSFELEFNSFHKKFSDSVSFSREVSHLLQNEIYALELNEKQNYLSMLSMKDIDSLNLENLLGISNKGFYHDSLLMQSGSMDYKAFLFANLDFEMKKIITPEKIEKGLYPILSTAFIEESQRYSSTIREFLLFTNITVLIQSLGLTPEIDSIAQKLRKGYPASEYLPRLLDHYKEFEYLLPGKKAPDFSGVSLDNKSYSLKDFRGNVILIDVWATWCASCIESFPTVQGLQEVFKDKPVTFFFIANDKDEKKWKTFLKDYKGGLKGIHFRISDSPFYDTYKISAIPRYILIDKEGKIVNAFAVHASEKLKSTIDNLLK
jgi:thiol-disulfide isomerase/thioredoxin